MISHPLRFHFGQHLQSSDTTLKDFAGMFTGHLNVCLSETGRTFDMASIDHAPAPPPETNPHVLPDEHAVDLYFFAEHPTQSGSLTVGGDGRVLLFVPLGELWTPDSNIEAYTVIIAKFQHEWLHARGRRGEGYRTKNCDPPSEVPMPRLNSWDFPNDIYWTQDRRAQMLDPFWTTHPWGHPLFRNEVQDLAWVLKNVRPCAGSVEIIRGNYRKGAPWNPIVRVATNTDKPIGVTVWSVPGDYRDPWQMESDITNLVGGPTEFVWSSLEHGSPMAAIRAESSGRVATGYISIFDLEHLAIAGIEPVVAVNFNTGTVALPQWPPPPQRPWWWSTWQSVSAQHARLLAMWRQWRR